MEITVSKHESAPAVVVMRLTGNLDASNYVQVIDKAYELHEAGAASLLVDLSRVPYVSSAGLMSLHTVVLIFSGQAMQSKTTGRPAFRPINLARDGEARKYVKLFNPQPEVDQVLDVVGLKEFFEIYTDLDAALRSF